MTANPVPPTVPVRIRSEGYRLSESALAETLTRIRSMVGDRPEATDEEMDAMIANDR